MQTALIERELCYSIVGAFFEVYNYFGCGLSESIYAAALEYELTDRGHRVEREVLIQVMFKGSHVGWQRVDMIVDERVIVENKATEKLPLFAEDQIESYLRVSPMQVGLILHFGAKAEHKRFVDTHKRQCASHSKISRRKNPPNSTNPPNSRSLPVPSRTDSEPGG